MEYKSADFIIEENDEQYSWRARFCLETDGEPEEFETAGNAYKFGDVILCLDVYKIRMPVTCSQKEWDRKLRDLPDWDKTEFCSKEFMDGAAVWFSDDPSKEVSEEELQRIQDFIKASVEAGEENVS